MIKKYNPTVKRSFNFWDNEYSYSPEMKESRSGKFIKIEIYNNLLKDHNKLQKEFEELKKAQNG